jgi:hypothetical protein
MKKIVATVALLLATSVFAGPYHYGHGPRYHGGGGGGWIAPLIGGAIIGAVITDAARANQPAPQPPIIIQSPQPVYQANTYNCLVQVYDPITRTIKNEVMICVNQ